MGQLHTFIQTLQSENASYRSQLVDQEDLTSSLGEMAKLKLELMKCHNDLKEAQVEAEQKHIFSTSLLEQIKELHTNAMEYESTIQLLHNEREDEELLHAKEIKELQVVITGQGEAIKDLKQRIKDTASSQEELATMILKI